MKVYVILQAQLFGIFTYYGIAKTKKAAENKLRQKFPHMVNTGMQHDNCTDYYSHKSYKDDDSVLILRIKEEEI